MFLVAVKSVKILDMTYLCVSNNKYFLNPVQSVTPNLGTGKKVWGGGGRVGRSREGVGHELLSLVQGVGRAIFSYP